MANLRSTRGAQWPLLAEFTVDFGVPDFMATTIGNTIGGAVPPLLNQTLVATNLVATNVYDAIQLPPSACVIGGELMVNTVTLGPTVATVGVGDQNSQFRYLAATSTLAAARTALTITGYRGVGENIRITTNLTVAPATQGNWSVRVMYMVQNRQNETQPN